MPNWIAKIPDALLYPVGWYLAAVDLIESHPHWSAWIMVALCTVALL